MNIVCELIDVVLVCIVCENICEELSDEYVKEEIWDDDGLNVVFFMGGCIFFNKRDYKLGSDSCDIIDEWDDLKCGEIVGDIRIDLLWFWC